jgi:hypothetical protein
MVRVMSLALAVVVVVGISASAQTNGQGGSKVQSTSGVAKAVSASLLTVERGGNEITFRVDRSTRVLARIPGRTGPQDLVWRTPPPVHKLTDFVKTGDQVVIKYRQSDSAMIAVEVRVAQK